VAVMAVRAEARKRSQRSQHSTLDGWCLFSPGRLCDADLVVTNASLHIRFLF